MKIGSPDKLNHLERVPPDLEWKQFNVLQEICKVELVLKKINKSNLCFSFPVLNVIAVEEKLLAPMIMRIFCHSITLSVALPKSSRRSSVSESFFSSSLHTAGAFFVPFSEMVGVFSPFAEVDFGFLWIKGHFKNGQTKLQAISLNLYVFL